ncbi:MAG: amino acid permease [Verrucomicrobiota bacterium]
MHLKKSLGLLDVFCIAAGAMISSGIFVLPGLAYAKAGPAVVIAYLLAGMLAATGLLSTAELTTAMPKAGSDYFFITRSMGPAIGTIAAVLNWASFSLKSAFALVGMGAVIRLLAPIDIRVSGMLIGLVFITINLLGVKKASRLQIVLVLGLIAIMLFYAFRGVPAVNRAHFTPFLPNGIGSVFATAGFVFVAYGGVLKVASMAEEVREPGRTIHTGMILSLLLVGLCYVLVVAVTVGLVPPGQLSGTLTPLNDGAAILMGPWGRRVILLAGTMAFLTTANAGIMAGSRYLLAISRDNLLPALFSRVGARFGTPYIAILATGTLVLAPLFINLRILVEAASIGLILTNMLAICAVIVLREGRVQNYQPTFRAPFYPWLQIGGLLGLSFVLFEMREEGFLISMTLVAFGFCLYWFYGRHRSQSESAMLHLVQRLTSRDLATGTLEAELKDIIRVRDDIAIDRFDKLIEHCPVLDLERTMDSEEFFTRAAEVLAARMKVPAEQVRRQLAAREQEGSTVLAPHLAIPHIIIEGPAAFDMLIARSKPGIRFSAEAPAISAAIVLAGSKTERNFHLRCLAAIAQVMQAPDFEARWLAANGEQALRDIFELSRRPRA